MEWVLMLSMHEHTLSLKGFVDMPVKPAQLLKPDILFYIYLRLLFTNTGLYTTVTPNFSK